MSQLTTFDLLAGADIMTLTGDIGAAVGPLLGNVDILGGVNITTTGTPNTITIDLVATIGVPLGGTGLTTITDHGVMVGSGVGAVTPLAVGATGEALLGVTGADPTWGAIDLTTTITGILPVPNGGTGLNTITDHAVMLGSGVGIVTPLGVGATGNVLTAVTGADPAWAQVDLASMVTGILPVPNGGTGLNTITDHGVMIGSGVGNVTPLAVGTNGQTLLGSTGADPVFATLGSTLSTIQYTTGAGTLALDCQVAQALSGFASWDGAGPYFDDTVLGDFEVSESGVGYVRGERVTWTAPQTETGMTAGNTYYIYIDDTGTIGKTTTYDMALFRDNIVLFECMRDSTAGTNLQVTVKENHPYTVPWETSVYLHDTIGTALTAHGGGANIILDGTQKIAISGADELEDHGLETDIPDSGGTGVTWKQYFTLGSGKWAQNSSTDTFVGEYNNAGTATALGGNKFGVYKLYVSKDNINVTTPTYFAVLHTAQFNNLVSAQVAIANGTIASISGELAELEMGRLGYIIFAESSTSIVDVIIDKETVGTGGTTAGTNQASLVLTNVTNFDGILSAADTTVQASLETIDDWGGGADDNAILIGRGVNTPIDALAVGATGETIMGNTGADPSWTSSPSFGGSVTAQTGLTATTGDIRASAGEIRGNSNLILLDTTATPVGVYMLGGDTAADRFMHNYGTQNTFLGKLAGNFTLTTGSAIRNTACGYNAFWEVTTGQQNSCFGNGAGFDVHDGSYNTLIGDAAGVNVEAGSYNSLVGQGAGAQVKDSDYNSAFGYNSLGLAFSGSYNSAFGYNAASALTTTDADNIMIGNIGTIGDNNKIIIGTQGNGNAQQNSCQIAGIYGVTVGGTNATVLIDNGGVLGTVSSSIRFKENVRDMANMSSDLMKLRPVVFNFKKDENKTIQYGLIAEEVAKVMPGIVNYDKENIPEGVRYHDMPAMLLNEIQKQNRVIEHLYDRIAALEERLDV